MKPPRYISAALSSWVLSLPVYSQVPSECVETLFAANNGGQVGGAVYFDVTVTQNVSFPGLLLNTSMAAGTPVGLEVYVTPTTYRSKENDPTVWTLLTRDDGQAVSAGADNMTSVAFLSPFSLNAGTFGIALVGNNSNTGLRLDHDYTNGNGTNQFYVSPDGVVSAEFGSATQVPFAGTPFSPRVWNGRLCHDGVSPLCTGTICSPAVPNSSGLSGCIRASGSASVSANDLVLEARDLPLNSFGFFLTSDVLALTPNPGGSMGILCLGGSIGRYVGPGEIRNSGALGVFSLAVDLTRHPTPTGSVAVAPGDTWNFTAWFRDVDPTGASTSNFTSVIEITFS